MLHYHTAMSPQINALPPRADFLPQGAKRTVLGEWDFSYKENFDGVFAHAGKTERIRVPSCWQRLGYDSDRYINFRYPFPFDPPHIFKKNPCGFYSCRLPARKEADKSSFILFGGVDSCFYLFVNGKFVGYSSVSHSPAEFDVTAFLNDGGEDEIAFAVLKERMPEQDGPEQKKEKVILATVKGDIHDIGKNIVKVLLENYGFDVIDLGKDVPPQLVAETALREDVRLVGLSALMTTTVVSMEETIRLLREQKPDCKVMVGGAVLNQEYADMIGADFYGKDAMQSVYYTQELFKGEN